MEYADSVSAVVGMFLYPLVSLVVVALAVGGANGRIKRNGYIGIRVPSTTIDDKAWRAGHRAACIPACIGAGIVITVTIALPLTSHLPMSSQYVDVAIVLILTLVGCMAAAELGARRALRAHR